ncbi:hypothetical protein HY478_01935 [Candidatus Uhrbacteria bacterium]|nr:hypothetical protein [Candidatus Uhrbacteria bacterium]
MAATACPRWNTKETGRRILSLSSVASNGSARALSLGSGRRSVAPQALARLGPRSLLAPLDTHIPCSVERDPNSSFERIGLARR